MHSFLNWKQVWNLQSATHKARSTNDEDFSGWEEESVPAVILLFWPLPRRIYRRMRQDPSLLHISIWSINIPFFKKQWGCHLLKEIFRFCNFAKAFGKIDLRAAHHKERWQSLYLIVIQQNVRLYQPRASCTSNIPEGKCTHTREVSQEKFSVRWFPNKLCTQQLSKAAKRPGERREEELLLGLQWVNSGHEPRRCRKQSRSKGGR